MDIFQEILKVLSSGEKTSFEIATELGFAPARVTARLATLASLQKVKKVGKTRSNGKEVMIYASTELVSKKAQASARSDPVNPHIDIAHRLYQKWGGYLSMDARPVRKHSTLKHKLE